MYVIPSEAKDLLLLGERFRYALQQTGSDRARDGRHFLRMKEYFVYILASKSRRLYVGVTNDITQRVAQHRAGLVSHTARYRIERLVYCETTSQPMAAIEREKQIKGWVRAKKVALIHSANPAWDDLAAGWTDSA